MADNSDSRESENNSWVIAGSEALPVEGLSLETSEEPQIEEDSSEESTQASFEESEDHAEDPHPEETEAKDPGVEADVPSEKAPVEPPKTVPLPPPPEKEPGGQEAEKPSEPTPRGPISIQKIGPVGEEAATSSSGEEFASRDRDVEGLRRRKGQDPTPLRPAAPGDRDRAVPGGEDGDRTKWLFGLLILTGLGLLVVLGGILDTEDGPMDVPDSWPDVDGDKFHPNGSDRPAFFPLEPPGDAGPQRVKEDHRPEAPREIRSLDAMGVLLDKLAKENQDIRLMQAELQAQKEELQALLPKTEGDALEFISQPQALVAQNTRLLEAIMQEKSSLLAAQAELQLLRDELHIPGDAVPDSGPPTEGHRHRSESREAEIHRLRDLLASIRRDVVGAYERVPPGEGVEGILAELGGVGQMLAQELEEEEEEDIKPLRRESPRKRKPKESQKRPTAPEERHSDGAKMPSNGHHHHHPRKHGARDAKPGKDSEDRRAVRKAKKPPREPSELWETLAKRSYKAPQDCANVAECARQEGLAPVQKDPFLRLVQSYMAGLGWAEHYEGLARALGGYFGSDGAFAHDRVGFVDFLDKVEDALEALAKYLGRSREEPDDFEEVILEQVGGLPGGRFTHRDGGRQQPKERNRDGYGRRNGREVQG